MTILIFNAKAKNIAKHFKMLLDVSELITHVTHHNIAQLLLLTVALIYLLLAVKQ